MSHYVLSPDEFRREFAGRKGFSGHVLNEASTDPVGKVFVTEKISLYDYRDSVVPGLGYRTVRAPEGLIEKAYTRLFVAGFDGENFAGFKRLKNARRHLRISEVLIGQSFLATTAHKDYLGSNPEKLLRAHLPQSVKPPFRIVADYQAGEQAFLEEFEYVNL